MQPLVSIICFAYNHEKFINDALASFIMQQVNFKYEIVVHDDASTDNTARLIKNYENKFPELFRPIYQIKNQASQERGRVTRLAFKAAKGKYIALCEGDDYWTDPYKLQKQVDFLEKKPDYHLCCTDYDERDEKNVINKSKLSIQFGLNHDQDITFSEYFNKRYIIRTLTVMFKRKIIESYFNEIPTNIRLNGIVGDIPLWFFILLKYKGRYLAINTSVYRIAEGTASHPIALQKKYDFRKGIILIRKYFAQLSTDKKLIKTVKLEYLKNEMFNCYITKNKLLVLKTFFKMILLRPREIKKIDILILILINKNSGKLKQFLNLNS